MNPDLPPIALPQPSIRPRRRERRGFVKAPLIPAAVRAAMSLRLRAQKEQIDEAVRSLSPEARRAVFLKLKHDRPLTKDDLAGTDLVFMSAPGADESLVVTRKEGLEKFDQRIQHFGEGDEPGRPKGTELAEKLKSLELGDPKDRLADEVLVAYDAWCAAEWVTYEIEIASFASHPSTQRKEVEAILMEIHAVLGRGIHGNVFESDVSARGARIVLRSSGAKFREFVEDAKWWRKIVFFDARPKFETFSQTVQAFNVGDVSIEGPPHDAETLCVVDTGVAALNPFLEKVIRRDLSRSFIFGCSPTADENGHGSGVASLAAYYQLEYHNGGSNRAAAFIASARIMSDDGQLDVAQAEDEDQDRQQQARLLSKILREIVEHYRPQGVRVFVLAFQILGHIWSKAARRQVARNAWVARTIDNLCREHDVVFVTITGNVAPHDVAELLEGAAHPEHLLHPLAKVLDPGQAALAVTSGSIASSAKVVVAAQVPIALPQQPSPFTRSGPGFGESIKPDVVERGGNLVRDPAFNTVASNAGTNIVMASGKLTPALQNSNGTSFAAPRVAHHLAVIANSLRELGVEPNAPLLRAILGASANRPDGSEMLDRDQNLALLGYGLPNGFEATDCKNHSVLLYWQGTLSADANALFRIHVPAELALKDGGRKRIVVSVASAPPVQPWGIAEYLGAEMKFRLFCGDKNSDEIEALLQRDDDEENVAAKAGVDDLKMNLGINRRSVGTLQRDTYEWTVHKEVFSADDYTLAVSLTAASWTKKEAPVPVAVVVRLEDTTGQFAELYARVRASIRARVAAQVRATTS
jgi:hypothetical protein